MNTNVDTICYHVGTIRRMLPDVLREQRRALFDAHCMLRSSQLDDKLLGDVAIKFQGASRGVSSDIREALDELRLVLPKLLSQSGVREKLAEADRIGARTLSRFKKEGA